MPSKDPTAEKTRGVRLQNKAMIKASFDAAKGVKAKYLFLYIDALEHDLIPEVLPKGLNLILVTKKKNLTVEGKTTSKQIIIIPKLMLGRIGMIKVAVILAISAKLVEQDDTIVFLGGRAEPGLLDILLTFKIGGESEIITGTDFADIPETVKPAIFEHA